MHSLLIVIFIIGYLGIALEKTIRVNKTAVALLLGVTCWTVYILASGKQETLNEDLMEHLGNISGILFFLLSAMVIVETIDTHDGFQIISERIKTRKIRELLWVTSFITFFLSAFLDNLTTTIIMLSMLHKLIEDKNKRWIFAGMVIIAANAGGAWSPLGDITTTMLWMGKQITASRIIVSLFIPSMVCMVVPLAIVSFRFKGTLQSPHQPREVLFTSRSERRIVLFSGIACLLAIPFFHIWTGLPPFMGILGGLGLMWVITEFIHARKENELKNSFSVTSALQKIDASTVLFFLGILLAISALENSGILKEFSLTLDKLLNSESAMALIMGLLSAIVDNVPLVAACQGMYSLEQFPTNHFLWEFLAYTTGTGGSALIIGSAAGVAAMGIEKIDFVWYLKKFTYLSLLGYFAGAVVYIIMQH